MTLSGATVSRDWRVECRPLEGSEEWRSRWQHWYTASEESVRAEHEKMRQRWTDYEWRIVEPAVTLSGVSR